MKQEYENGLGLLQERNVLKHTFSLYFRFSLKSLQLDGVLWINTKMPGYVPVAVFSLQQTQEAYFQRI